MNKIAIIFRQPPHGLASGREGLDAVLAASALSDELGVFFLGDGVYQLLPGQQPQGILGRDYAPTFKLFELYDIEAVFLCRDSLAERQLDAAQLLLAGTPLDRAALREQLAHYQVHLVF